MDDKRIKLMYDIAIVLFILTRKQSNNMFLSRSPLIDIIAQLDMAQNDKRTWLV